MFATPNGLLPARLQKVSVERTRVILEVYAAEKRWIVLDAGQIDVVTERPTREEAAPPAVQGLLRKELSPAMLMAIDDDGTVVRLTFKRLDEKVRLLLLERTRDARVVVGAVVDDGVRVLAVVGPPRANDGRDLRRGALYCPPSTSASPGGPDAAPASDGAAAGVAHGESPAPTTGAAPLKPGKPIDPLALLRARIKAEHKRVKRLVDALERDLAKHGDPAEHERLGELLKPLLGKVKRGMDHVDTVDWEGAPVTIALDPALDAKANLERLFKRSKKARAGIARIEPRLAEARARLADVESARANNDVAAAERMLAKPETGGSARRRAAKAGTRQSWRSFKCANDVVVRVGRGAKDNDALVKSARGNDLWLHARDQQGAHVIVPQSGADSDDVVLDAATLAAHFSSGRGEPRVDVQHTRVKNLKKGPAPGLVLVSNETVIHLRVDVDRLTRLLAAEVPS